MAEFQHLTVLLNEAVEALVYNPDGFYIDGTFGRGGHSRLILNALSAQGRLLGIDKDPQAVAEANRLQQQDGRFSILHDSFAAMQEHLQAQGLVGQVDGVLVDLGVSSPQLDDAERGFSFLNDGPLDMRMNPTVGESAAQWLAREDEAEIARVLKEYGEERFGKRIARAIVTARAEQPILRTGQLAKIVAEANPAWEKGKNPATRSFQGIRIHINNELADLESFLDQALAVLKPGGRLVVISFHSLEDRLVKRFIRHHQRGGEIPAGMPLRDDQLNRRLRPLGKASRAGGDEVEENVRARSAIMRVAEKIK